MQQVKFYSYYNYYWQDLRIKKLFPGKQEEFGFLSLSD